MLNQNNKFAFEHGFLVPDDMLMAIGCSIICQSHIEVQLGVLISEILSIDQQKSFVLTSNMSYKILCTTLSSLLLQIIPDTDSRYQDFRTHLSSLQEFEEFRNKAAHSIWTYSQDFNKKKATRIKTIARQYKPLRHDREEIDVIHISERIKKAMQSLVRIMILVDEVIGKPIDNVAITNDTDRNPVRK